MTGNVNPIYNEALTAFHSAFTRCAEIFPDGRTKITKLKFTLVPNNIIGAIERILGNSLASEFTATNVQLFVFTINILKKLERESGTLHKCILDIHHQEFIVVGDYHLSNDMPITETARC